MLQQICCHPQTNGVTSPGMGPPCACEMGGGCLEWWLAISCSLSAPLMLPWGGTQLGCGTGTVSFLVALQPCLWVVAEFWIPSGELDLHPPMQAKESQGLLHEQVGPSMVPMEK